MDGIRVDASRHMAAEDLVAQLKVGLFIYLYYIGFRDLYLGVEKV